jgi:hypothetical protein
MQAWRGMFTDVVIKRTLSPDYSVLDFSIHPIVASYSSPLFKKNSRYKKTARIEHNAVLQWIMIALLADRTELFKQFSHKPCPKGRGL